MATTAHDRSVPFAPARWGGRVVFALLAVGAPAQVAFAVGGPDLDERVAILEWLAGLGFLAMLVAPIIAAMTAAAVPRGARAPREWLFIPPLAAGFLLAHLYSYDPYYLPDIVTYAEHGTVAPALAYVLAAACGGVALSMPRS